MTESEDDTMKYISTRDTSANPREISSAEAIIEGIAPDGGLYIPKSIPRISAGDFDALMHMNYPERAAYVLAKFLDDYDIDELYEDCEKAYSTENFSPSPIAVKKLSSNMYSLELWHGRTCAFKDLALTLMPRLLSRALKTTGEKKTMHILVATSGDTGKAALEGYRDIDGVKITCFYPADGVSEIQKLQMQTSSGKNVYTAGVRGSFDDVQSGVKTILSSERLHAAAEAKGYILGSANSINWGRLVPQVVYYISAYCDLCSAGEIETGDRVNIAVPTGNFGNILAAYIAMKMGLPVDRFICASNSNNVLTDFINTGVYDRRRALQKTITPSMDIILASNIERLICLFGGAELTVDLMEQLSRKGYYKAPEGLMDEIRKYFSAYSANEDDTMAEIYLEWEKDGYLLDPHTAVALGSVVKFRLDTGNVKKTIIASTASPYKFAPSVCDALGILSGKDIFETMDILSEKTGTEIPTPLTEVRTKEIRFRDIIDKGDMMELAFRK